MPHLRIASLSLISVHINQKYVVLSPRQCAAPIRTFRLKVLLGSKNHLVLGMAFTYSRQAVVQPMVLVQVVDKLRPSFFSTSAFHERFRISYHNQCLASPGQQYIKSLWCGHESNITLFVTASKRCNNNITFFTLVVV